MIPPNSYVLVTAAYNEEAFIEQTLKSVVAQSVLPRRWVIVSDGSTDRTDEIVQRYAAQYSFVELLRIVEKPARDFRSKVHALNSGIDRLKGMQYQYIGILDADVSFGDTYFADLLTKFGSNRKLGLAGGFILEKQNGHFQGRTSNRTHSVAGAIQMFRLECFEALGRFVGFKYGGEDWFAEITARMNGWQVAAFPELEVKHHRPTGGKVGQLRYYFSQGITDFSFGCYAPFVFLKCMIRLKERPYVLGAISRLAGFIWAYCRGQERWVSEQVAAFLSNEQKTRVSLWCRGAGAYGVRSRASELSQRSPGYRA